MTRVLRRFGRYVKNDVWRPDEPKASVRKNKPGVGWTINLAALHRGHR